ncbi:Neither inactivation nor afterpotential protein C [Trachymyrmex septentrionalis]|uniref:non-specific serine/threonine protein kinase n=1 Tax=Trachymyrmex septentrionalis TaxID=34720 RepID=A0A195EYW1_9HYME|nr:PREDICTED: neither inactivation nor afterpotential protein C [Trachymyrmex septentrionalis]KYN33316.1 Neither inactivation nor afterpotential protein C [Trachymyrmex septentrionalis]
MNDFGKRKNDWHDNVQDEQREMENRSKNRDTGSVTLKRLDSIQDPGKRYALKDRIGTGIYGDVYEGIDHQAGNKKVAIKIQKLTPETQSFIVEEYRILRDFAGHPNLPDFYGIYRKRSPKKSDYDEIWFVMELCEGGTIMDLVRGIIASDKRIQEEHIAFILKEVIKALIHLHEHNVIHRDIRGNNIVLTKEGEVKLVDFGLSRTMKNEFEKRRTYIGSPSWMAPEMIGSKDSGVDSGYDSRIDVWAIGITAIEVADGKAPFQDMHPTRALFQIIRNPPPTLYRPANWSKNLNDFISECLEKNPENRPYMMEIIEHPFLSELPENDYPLTQEIKALTMNLSEKGKKQRKTESIVHQDFLKTHQNEPPEQMLTEDLAALDTLTEDVILDELRDRLQRGEYHTFIGDILLILNPNEKNDIYGVHHHAKYQCKSRSDNAPHIYSVADSAFQDVMLNEESQHILLAGESNSGKTTNMLHLVEHLMFLGKGLHDTGVRVLQAIKIIHAFTNAGTPLNVNSTRCILQTQTTFGSTGKASGAIFWLYQLEKWRVSTRDRNQSNFHVFYYFYDGLEASENLKPYFLPSGRKLRYLRIIDKNIEKKRAFKVRNDPQNNVIKLKELTECFKFMDMEEYCETIWKILAAILILGEIRFVEGNNGEAELNDNEIAIRVAELLGLDSKKFIWALVNYCLVVKGSAVRKKHTCEEAKEARDVLANTLYQRLVDWIINIINYKLSMTRSLYGDKYSISILDHFGLECFSINRLEQLLVNTINEQMQYYYNQRVFTWEMQEQEEEDIPIQRLRFYDNKEAIDQLMNKGDGLFHIIDDASRQMQDAQYILERIKEHKHSTHIKPVSLHEFMIAHYTGKLIYDASEIATKNRDFVPPEMINTMRYSLHNAVKDMFTNKLTKSGNLTIVHEHYLAARKTKWSTLMQESSMFRKYNTASKGQYSQTRKMRTCSSTFRATSLEILKNLAIGARNGGTHFVRCIRSDLEDAPRSFYREVVRQQIKALGVLDTAKARRRGYPYRIPFQEFLRRYKFLAFDFDEIVEMTKDNCRLLLIRLKMEGWIIGKSKVFLKYYNEEYLSRLYETQVRKIIKIQCIIRAFLARKNIALKINDVKKEIVKKASIKRNSFTEGEAALMIQKTFRGHMARKEMGPLLKEEMSQETKDFIKFYCSKWRSKSMFQVLLWYRAARYQDFVQLSQQVHLYNQSIMATLQKLNENVSLEKVDPSTKIDTYISKVKPPEVYKLPFNIQQEFPYFDMNYINDPSNINIKRGSISSTLNDDEHESWDAPLRRQTVPWANKNIHTRDIEVQTTNSPHRMPFHRSSINNEQNLINTPFTRDPNVPIQCPSKELPRRSISSFQLADKHGSIQSSESYIPYSNINKAGLVHSKTKVSLPSVPLNQAQPSAMRNLNNYESDIQNKNDNTEWEFENKINRNVNNDIRINPIKELEMIGRRNNNDKNDDEPPFNFQAMLRKTSHQRASMKRNPVYESITSPESPKSHHSDLDESNTAFKSDDNHKDSPEWSPNEMILMSEKYAKENAWNEEDAKDSVTTEIAPGIIVKGYVADL